MKQKKLLNVNLSLFDGAAAAGEGTGAGTPGRSADSGEKGGVKTAPGSTRRGKSGEFSGVLYGRQEAGDAQTIAAPSDAG